MKILELLSKYKNYLRVIFLIILIIQVYIYFIIYSDLNNNIGEHKTITLYTKDGKNDIFYNYDNVTGQIVVNDQRKDFKDVHFIMNATINKKLVEVSEIYKYVYIEENYVYPKICLNVNKEHLKMCNFWLRSKY